MKRGEIWTTSGGKDYARKPRPAVILQDDRFESVDSATLCSFTSDPTKADLFRVEIQASSDNGLKEQSWLMADKITTVPKSKLGKKIGALSEQDMIALERAILTFLGITQ